MRNKIKIYHCSDTHGYHKHLKIPDETIDVMVFTGDESNYRLPKLNESEFIDFINWYAEVPVQNKIMIAGNHSSILFTREKWARKEIEDRGIIYLNKESITLHGLKFYGDPTSPRFGDWCFMSDRNKIKKHWEFIPKDTDILLTHTPPKGILDLTKNRDNNLEMCGCSSLGNKIKELPKLRLNCFGHIHNVQGITNTGLRVVDKVIYSNAAAVTDLEFDKGITFNGNMIEL